MEDLIIGGIALGPIITALVQLAKKFGLPSGYAPYLNAGLSVLGYFGMVMLGLHPGFTEWVVVVLQILIIFLSAAGVYSTVKWASGK